MAVKDGDAARAAGVGEPGSTRVGGRSGRRRAGTVVLAGILAASAVACGGDGSDEVATDPAASDEPAATTTVPASTTTADTTPETTEAPTTTAPPETTTTVATLPSGLQADGLTTDGAAPLAFGDPIARAEEVTGTRAQPACGLGDASQIAEISLDPGLTLWFSQGSFSGWSISEPGMWTPSGLEVGLPVVRAQERVPELVDDGMSLVLGEVPTNLVAAYGPGGIITTIDASAQRNLESRAGVC